MKYQIMTEKDIERVIPLYMDYYNNREEGEWTPDTVYKRIHQVISREDSFCLMMEDEDLYGFAMGYFEQYDDLTAYDLVEIVIASEHQKKGLGTAFLRELERQVKEKGASMIQLQAVNDEMHNRFYGRLCYKNAENLILKSKWLE